MGLRDSVLQFVKLLGRNGGQIINGGINAGEELKLVSTNNATKGNIFFGESEDSVYDEVNDRLGLGTTTPDKKLHVDESSTNPAIFERDSATTNISLRCAEFHRKTSGTAAPGIGAEIALRVEDDAGNIETVAVISGILTDVTSTAEIGDVIIEGVSDSALAEAIRIKGFAGNEFRVGIGTPSPVADLDVNGGVAFATRSLSDNATATINDYTLLMTTGATDKTITLPLASTCAGLILSCKKIDAGIGNMIIDGNGAETIDGAATQTFTAQFDTVMIQCDGTEWFILARIG